MFILQDSRTNVWSSAMFWRLGGGYTSNLAEAEQFTKEQAQAKHNSRETDIPLLFDLVYRENIIKVDMQYLPRIPPSTNDAFIVQRKGYYDGNDIYMISDIGKEYTTDFMKAGCFSLDEVNRYFSNKEIYALYEIDEIERISRPTMPAAKINKRKMATNQGIKLIKPKRIRPTSGKTRGNCPTCGRITWGYDPHIHHLCRNCL